jgi:FRG domain
MSFYQETTITSFNELTNTLFGLVGKETFGRYRCNYVFRGVEDEGFSLKPSIARLGIENYKLESNIFNNFKKYAAQKEYENFSFLHFLSLAQHHGLPTRLLDWTWSPLISIFFATEHEEYFNKDAAIWCVNASKIHTLMPDTLKTSLYDSNHYFFTIELLNAHFHDFGDFNHYPFPEGVGDHAKNWALFFEPPSLDARIVNQLGVFSVCSDPEMDLLDFIRENNIPDIHKIIIPKELKWEIKDKLDMSNINERILYPGLNGLATWLKRHYTNINR